MAQHPFDLETPAMVHLSLGVDTLVALMQAHRPAPCEASRTSIATRRHRPDIEEAARIDAWLQGDMLQAEPKAGSRLFSGPNRPT
jgi:hypothetical protein